MYFKLIFFVFAEVTRQPVTRVKTSCSAFGTSELKSSQSVVIYSQSRALGSPAVISVSLDNYYYPK